MNPRTSALPILSDVSLLLQRLAREEKALLQELTQLEEKIRRFEDEDRPNYEAWLRVEFGPKLSLLEGVIEELRNKRVLVHRIETLTEQQGLHPREALYVATQPESVSPLEDDNEPRPDQGPSSWDPDEIAARRQAKREAKRDARRESKQEKKRARHDATGAPAPMAASHSPRRKLLSLYRVLARKLHPDSTEVIVSDRTQRLWLEVQEAYEAGNYDRLLSVAAWLGTDGSVPSITQPTLSERLERNRSLAKSSMKLTQELLRLEAHPAWAFTQPSTSRAQVRKRAAREVEQELLRAQDALTAYEEFIESLGTPKPPRRGKRS